MNKQIDHIHIKKNNGDNVEAATDQVAVEEPLEIQVAYSTANGYMRKNIAVTMRTPGDDQELAAGFLFTEGIIKNGKAISSISHLANDENRVLVTFHENLLPILSNTDRNFYSTSSCGVCGKASIDHIITKSLYQDENDNIQIKAVQLYGLQDVLKTKQTIFEHTGGIHASALFNLDGTFVSLREDVGRHNALDKIIGASLLSGQIPLTKKILLLSGRASFELIQKAAMAGIKIVVAVGAPSSLAVELAKETGITLIGFLRDRRFNLYSGCQRIEI